MQRVAFTAFSDYKFSRTYNLEILHCQEVKGIPIALTFFATLASLREKQGFFFYGCLCRETVARGGSA
jgi:hypothetical protein